MLGNQPFHRDTIFNILNAFGHLFSGVYVDRTAADDTEAQVLKVPIRYGPKDQLIARVKDNPDLVKEIAITYPRMSYEFVGMAYDPSRALNKLGKAISTSTNFVYNPAPYNIGINLYIITKNAMDGYRIIEQIVPIFMPSFTLVVNSIEGKEDAIPVTLGAVQQQDNWEGGFEQRQILWTLSFSLKAYIYGADHDLTNIIKQVIVNFYDSETEEKQATVTVQPGLTANGIPTSNLAITIPYQDINSDDPFGIITTITEP